MFSALNQGNLVYILDKSEGLQYKVGEITSTTLPQFSSDGSGMTIKLNVKTDTGITEYSNIPSTATSVSYNSGKIIIAESKQYIQSEVEGILHNANHIIEHISEYQKQIVQCEEILKELNPQYAKDKARDEDITGLKQEVSSIKEDIAKILEAVSKH